MITNKINYAHNFLTLKYRKEERAVKIGAVEFIDQFVPMMEAYFRANAC